jgi:hypothetical protein
MYLKHTPIADYPAPRHSSITHSGPLPNNTEAKKWVREEQESGKCEKGNFILTWTQYGLVISNLYWLILAATAYAYDLFYIGTGCYSICVRFALYWHRLLHHMHTICFVLTLAATAYPCYNLDLYNAEAPPRETGPAALVPVKDMRFCINSLDAIRREADDFPLSNFSDCWASDHRKTTPNRENTFVPNRQQVN